MTAAMWSYIEAFGWAAMARELWSEMTALEREAIVRAAKAEEASINAYNAAYRCVDVVEERMERAKRWRAKR